LSTPSSFLDSIIFFMRAQKYTFYLTSTIQVQRFELVEAPE
jgi:hypothetical protein